MVCTLYKNSLVKITNEKTGDTVYIDEHYHRSVHKRIVLGKKILRGRQWAIQNGLGPSSEIKFNYNLPDEEPFPHELNIYKEKNNENQ